MTKVYVACHQDDSAAINEFSNQLSTLQIEARVSGTAMAGSITQEEEKSWLEEADFVILLLSSGLLADNKLMGDLEAVRDTGKRIIPVLWRPCLWGATWLASIPVLKSDEGPIMENDQFYDSRCVDVARQIGQLVKGEDQVVLEEKEAPGSALWKYAPLIVVIGLMSILLLCFAHHLIFQHGEEEDLEPVVKEQSFVDSLAYHIAVWEFHPNRIDTTKRPPEELIDGRFKDIMLDTTLHIECIIYRNRTGPTQTKQAEDLDLRQVSEIIDSDLNIYGNYELLPNGTVSIHIKYFARNLHHENLILDRENRSNAVTIKTLTVLSEGQLTTSAENIVYWALGIKAFEEERYLVAIQEFRRMLKTKGSKHAIMQALAIGECYMILQKPGLAVNEYNKALQLDSTNIKALNNKAKVLMTLGKTGEAIALLEKAAAQDSLNETVTTNLQAARQARQRVVIELIPTLPRHDSLVATVRPNGPIFFGGAVIPEKWKSEALQAGDIVYKDYDGWSIVQRGTKFGFAKDSLLKIPCVYDEVDNFENGLARVYLKDVGYGFINEEHQYVVGMRYRRAEPYKNGVSIVASDKFYGLIDERGEDVYPLEAKHISPFLDQFYLVEDTSGFGLINSLGQSILPLDHTNLEPFLEVGILVERGGKFGLFDFQGDPIISISYDGIKPFGYSDYYMVINGNRKGLINHKGKLVVFWYHDIDILTDWYLSAKIGEDYKLVNKRGYVFFSDTAFKEISLIGERALKLRDKQGKVRVVGTKNPRLPIISPNHGLDEVLWLNENYYAVQRDSLWGIFTDKGQPSIPVEYDSIAYVNGYFLVKKGGRYGVINEKNEPLVAIQYNSVRPFDIGLYLVGNGKGQFGLVNDNNQTVVEVVYESIQEITIDYVLVKKQERKKWKTDSHKYGVIRLLDGKTILQSKYDSITSVGWNFFKVKKGGLWGVLDLEGKKIVPIAYNHVKHNSEAHKHFFIATRNRKRELFNEKKKLSKERYDEIGRFREKMARVKRGGLYGFIDLDGNLTVPIKYIWTSKTYSGNARVLVQEEKDGPYFYINRYGEKIGED